MALLLHVDMERKMAPFCATKCAMTKYVKLYAILKVNIDCIQAFSFANYTR